MARAALDTLDEPFRTHARAVAIKVEDFADDETLETMKIENPYELTGLYSGVALTLETALRALANAAHGLALPAADHR